MAVLVLAASTALPQPALSQATCAPRDQIVLRLAERYGETLQGSGLHQNSSVLEVYASDETGTWTILISRPDGMACMIAAGEMWTDEPQTPRGDPA